MEFLILFTLMANSNTTNNIINNRELKKQANNNSNRTSETTEDKWKAQKQVLGRKKVILFKDNGRIAGNSEISCYECLSHNEQTGTEK